MYCRATCMVAAGIWAMALSAQTVAPKSPGRPQFTVTPQSPAARQLSDATLRELVTRLSQGETAVCSIPLHEVRADPFSSGSVAKDVEAMPTFRPGERIDNMSKAMPAPPCGEERR